MHRKNPQRTGIEAYQGGGPTEIAAHKRSYAVGFFRQAKNPELLPPLAADTPPASRGRQYNRHESTAKNDFGGY